MRTILRGMISVVAFFGTYLFTHLLLGSMIYSRSSPAWLGILWWAVSLLCASLAARYVWTRTKGPESDAGVPAGEPGTGGTPDLLSCAGLGALAVGGLGFVGGFFGPLLLTPEANQGPLLGLFITGPLGVIIGALGGVIYWSRGRRSG